MAATHCPRCKGFEIATPDTSGMSGGPALAIMAKAPRVGRSKTRLIPALGAETACKLSAAFLADLGHTVAEVASASDGQGYGIFAPADAQQELAAIFPASFHYLPMTGDSFGDALSDTTDALLARGHSCVILINGDSPTLPSDYLAETIKHLNRPGPRIVCGPALDGGYYLIGLKAAEPRLFQDIAWSTSSVLEQSLTRAKEIDLEASLIPAWYDVDDHVGLQCLASEFANVVPPGLDCVGAAACNTRKLFHTEAALIGISTALRAHG